MIATRIPCVKIIIPTIQYKDHNHEELRKDIETNEMLNPITVKELPDGQYRLVDGYRRLMVCLSLNQDMINVCIIPEGDPRYVPTYYKSHVMIMQRMLESMTVDQAAEKIGRSVEWVKYMIKQV